MTENTQQHEERLAFESLQRNLSGLAYIEPMNPPAPDIRGRFHMAEIAVEVTRVDRDRLRAEKLGFQQQLLEATQSVLKDQIPTAKDVCLNVVLSWNSSRSKTSKTEIQKSAWDLAKWIKQRVPFPMHAGYYFEEFPEWRGSEPKSLRGLISEIRIATYQVTEQPESSSLSDCHVELCSFGGSPCRPSVTFAEVESAIEDKIQKMSEYRSKFGGPIWLLLTYNFDDISMPLDISESCVASTCNHDFQRVFLIDHRADHMIEILRSDSAPH